MMETKNDKEVGRLLYLKNLCIECKSISCQFNHYGECRFALVHERKPRINDYDGWCIDAITRRDIE